MALGCAAALAACSMAPDYQTPEQPLPNAYRQSDGLLVQTELPSPGAAWWKRLGSHELDGLVERALANNHDLKAAVQRVLEAQAQARAAGAAEMPQISGVFSQTVSAPDGNIGDPLRYDKQVKQLRTDKVALRASYEFDLWGKNANSVEAALRQVQASVFDRKTLALSLVGDVINTYLQYLQYVERLRVAQANVDSLRQTLGLVEKRAAVQDATILDMTQQRTALARAQSLLPVYALLREQSRNRLAILLGEAPSNLELSRSSLMDLTVPNIGPGLPSELLLRRPDIGKSEAALKAANANIGVARAKYLPSFSLSAEGGRASNYLADLLSAKSLYYSLISSVTQTIFDGGMIAAGVDYEKAHYQELVETYRQSILNALRDVEDALAGARYNLEQEQAEQAVFKNAHLAYTMSRKAYESGALEYLTLLETDRARYAAEDSIIQVRFARLGSAVGLAKALGGDMDEAAAKKE